MAKLLPLLPAETVPPPAADVRTRLARWGYALSHLLAMYLPALLMALLALLTYWMVRMTPPILPPEPERVLRHAPDYFLRSFSIRSYGPGGELKSELRGSQARHYQDTEVLDIDNPRIRSYDREGRLVTGTAQRALSNGDGSEVQLLGDAQLVREAFLDANGHPVPRMEFRGEFLHALLNIESVRSHKPVSIVRGQDHFNADSLSYDNLGRVVELTGRVKATVAPRPKDLP